MRSPFVVLSLISTSLLFSSAFQLSRSCPKHVSWNRVRGHSMSSVCGVKAAVQLSKVEAISRRSFGAALAGFIIHASARQTANAEALDEATMWKEDAKNGFQNYTGAANGMRYRDVKIGVGAPPKNGDALRFRYAAYLLDGTLASTYAGVEQSQVILGAKEIPIGLEEGLTGMQVGGQRILVIPPEIGWTSTYRAAAGLAMRPCGSQKCPLDTQPVVVVLSLGGYHKSECAAIGDIPITADLTQLKQEGKIVFNIGSDICPQGDIEVTERVERAKAMIERLKSEGKIQMEGKRPKTWVDM